MQLHNQFRPAALQLADAFDTFFAGAARARLHAQAAWARLLYGKHPIEFVAGPATGHAVVDDNRLARLLHYPAAAQPQGASAEGQPASGQTQPASGEMQPASVQAQTASGPDQQPAKNGAGMPLLVVASLINRYYVMDLLPELSVFAQLNRRGFDIYVLDWKAPGALGPSLTFADYVDDAIPAAARLVSARHGRQLPSLIGYCMGGTLAAVFAARHPTSLRALTLLGTPIEFGKSGELARMTERGRFDADLLMDALGNMPPAMMQSGFKLLNPADVWNKLIGLVRDGGDAERVRHFVALESWLDDNVAFPGGVYREYIRALYQEDLLCKRTMTIAGTPVDLARLTAPLLNVVGLRDHICAPPAARALMPLVGSTDKRLLEFDTGHIGLTTSRRSLGELWPRIGDWLEAHA